MIFLKRQVMTQIHRAGQAAIVQAEEVHDPHLLFQIHHLVRAWNQAQLRIHQAIRNIWMRIFLQYFITTLMMTVLS